MTIRIDRASFDDYVREAQNHGDNGDVDSEIYALWEAANAAAELLSSIQRQVRAEGVGERESSISYKAKDNPRHATIRVRRSSDLRTMLDMTALPTEFSVATADGQAVTFSFPSAGVLRLFCSELNLRISEATRPAVQPQPAPWGDNVDADEEYEDNEGDFDIPARLSDQASRAYYAGAAQRADQRLGARSHRTYDTPLVRERDPELERLLNQPLNLPDPDQANPF